METIHKESDFKHKIIFTDETGEKIDIPICPYEITYWTNDFDKKEATFDGEKYTNCIVENGDLWILIDKPSFSSGKLNCKITLHYPDVRFDNGFYDVTYLQQLDVKIVGNNGR